MWGWCSWHSCCNCSSKCGGTSGSADADGADAAGRGTGRAAERLSHARAVPTDVSTRSRRAPHTQRIATRPRHADGTGRARRSRLPDHVPAQAPGDTFVRAWHRRRRWWADHARHHGARNLDVCSRGQVRRTAQRSAWRRPPAVLGLEFARLSEPGLSRGKAPQSTGRAWAEWTEAPERLLSGSASVCVGGRR